MPKTIPSSWKAAWKATEGFLKNPGKSDRWTDRWTDLDSNERRRALRLFLGVLRHRGCLDAFYSRHLKKAPRARLLSLLLVAGFELKESDPSRWPQVVHAAVNCARQSLSLGESRLVNAVLRRLVTELEADSIDWKSSSHPEWLLKRWRGQFSEVETEALIEWNQCEAETWVRWRSREDEPPPVLVPTHISGFYRLDHGVGIDPLRTALSCGHAYIQDPFTRYPVDLLEPVAGGKYLDLCAAPGGKSIQILDRMSGTEGVLVACDVGESRCRMLRENLSRKGPDAKLLRADTLVADVRELSEPVFRQRELPSLYDGVLIDVPCSNTGVIGRRPEVRWLLSAQKIEELSSLQLELLRAASQWVRPGGRLVYSTCSLEQEENQQVVDRFLDLAGGEFSVESSRLSLPWKDLHDGGGAFLLTRGGAPG